MAEPNIEVLQVLVQEAQQEIGNLRAELYNTRRLAEERRQALDAMTSAKDQLAAVAHQLEGKVQSMHQQLLQLPILQQELQSLHELHRRLQKDSQLQQQARRILESELADERSGRSAAEEARARAEAERAKLALARDDLAAQIRVAKQKAADAEEEQLRAEEEAALLRRELGLLQAPGAAAGAGEGSDETTVAGAAAGMGVGVIKGAAARAELDVQQAREASLVKALQDAQGDAAAARAEVLQLKQQLSSSKELAQQHAQKAAELQAAVAASAASQSKPSHHQADADQVAILQARAAAAEQSLAAADDRVVALQRDLAAAQQQAAKAAAELQQLKAAATTTAVAGGSGTGAAAPAAAVHDEEEEQALQEQVELLMMKVVSLKNSRDKLLAQMDRQSEEMEQLMQENQALSESLLAAEQQTGHWRAQAQDALLSISKLHSPVEGSNNTTVAQDHQADGLAAAADDHAEHAAGLQGAVSQEQRKIAQLDAQVRVLSAQLLRMHVAYQGAGRSLLPILGGVEARLLSLLARSTPCTR